ncbi:MAG TPA: hypothetical protein VFE13_01995 [Caulobacteraceae bacterium]|nr:hypothetical protein [Caulobacteraceae bacterium]
MRSALLISAGLAVAMAGQALAASPTASGSSNMPGTDAPMQSTPPATSSRTTQPPASTTPSTSPGSSPTGSPSDTSATARSGAAAPAALTVGEPVKDNTGATIGAISSVSTGANGQQMAVIKMGSDTFQVSSDKLGVADGAATINLSQAQISGMLHPPAGGH